MTIRSVTANDIPLLAEYWYDQMALYSQKQAMMQLKPNADEVWQAYAQSLLHDTEVAFIANECKGELLGCIIGRITTNKIGLLPEKYGQVDDIILDLHSPHKQHNTVTELLAALKNYLFEKNIVHLIVHVPNHAPVEQAFWRGLGATHIEDTFWMNL